MPHPWDILSSSLDHSYRIFNIRTDRSVSPRTGEPHDFFVLESRPWVNVIPVTSQGEVVMVRQYRHGIRETTLEIPGGLVEEQDTPRQAAARELQEETGYTAADFRFLGSVHPNPAIQDNQCHTYLAESAVINGPQAQDEKEDIQVVRHRFEDVPGLINSGRITHSLVLCAFFLYFLRSAPSAFSASP
jgi:8-oxo-dGTP pyrophosphatase MutT (NUDIX family)